MSIPKPIWIGFVIGVALGAVLFVLSFLTAFGICSDTSIAEIRKEDDAFVKQIAKLESDHQMVLVAHD